MRRIYSIIAASATLLGVMLGLAGPAAADTLAQQVAALDVAAEHRAGYDRDLFGDYDRAALLETNFADFPACDGYYSRYDGQCYTDASEVDVDHRVALAEAWDSGAWQWGDAQRDQFAADVANLALMTDNLNQSKGDDDIAEWTPPYGPSVCGYTRAYVATKTAYDLSVDTAEQQALVDLAGRCGGSGNGGNGGNGGSGGNGQPGDGSHGGGQAGTTTDGTDQTIVVPQGGVDTGDGSTVDNDSRTAAALTVIALVAIAGTLWGLTAARRRV